jgi:hypothetical protein
VPFDQAFDYSYANFDRRHVLGASWVYMFPFGKGRGWLRYAFGGWQTSGMLNWASGLHTSVSGGSRDASSPSIGYGSVDLVGDWQAVPVGSAANQWVNSAAFAGRLGSVGQVPRNLIQMPATQVWNLTLSKQFKVRERLNVTFRAECFNAFNHTNWNSLSTNLTSSDFGQLNGADDPRVFQLALKAKF